MSYRFLIHLEAFQFHFFDPLYILLKLTFAPLSQKLSKRMNLYFLLLKMKWIKNISLLLNRPIRDQNFSENPA